MKIRNGEPGVSKDPCLWTAPVFSSLRWFGDLSYLAGKQNPEWTAGPQSHPPSLSVSDLKEKKKKKKHKRAK